MIFNFYQAINIIFVIYLALVSFRKLNVEGGKSFLFLSIASIIYFSSNLADSLWPVESVHSVMASFSILGMMLVATAIFTFSLEYTFRSYWITWLVIILFAVIPLLTQTGYWVFISNSNSISAIEHLSFIYMFSLIVASVWILGQENHYIRSKQRNLSYLLLIVGPVLTLIATGLHLTIHYCDCQWLDSLYSVGLLLCLVGFTREIFFQKPNVRQLRRDSMLENISDSWIILDIENRITDCNRAAIRLLNLPPEKLFGESISDIFEEYLNVHVDFESQLDGEIEKNIPFEEKHRYFNIQISSLLTKAETPVGKLVIMREITDRKRVESARRQARDEMFVLLNTISNAASQTISLKEFLSDVIYQIIYPFRSQSIFVYVLDDKAATGNAQNNEFYLAAHLGLSDEGANRLNKLSNSSALFRWLDEEKQHLMWENLRDSDVPLEMRSLNLTCLLAIPLAVQDETEKKLIGALFLGRRENAVYQQDDIVRLTILADHIAALIDSDRRRKLAISLLERQRLMRDIHDSVSQKLYGLVALTEAAQAGIEAGSEMDYEHVLSRIGENARQAVKELRLFLFQMQPNNLEKEGLISVLHHRLAAVEGRADIKVRFLADEPIHLTKRKEIALYYIAQEALNNILRHARAKSVSVTLKQGYKYVTLQIADDGCGFDQSNIKKGGLGLENIKERVKQENGKLKISSKPNKGTVIKVTFKQSKLVNSKGTN